MSWTRSAVSIKIRLICCGVRLGFASRRTAAAPATTGEAAEVLRFDLYVQGFNFTNAEGAQYLITGSNAGSIDAIRSSGFSHIQNLTGGSGDDTFTFFTGRSLTGAIDGGGAGPKGNTVVGNGYAGIALLSGNDVLALAALVIHS